MRLSVIIPVYNERQYIERVLERVVQALPDVEKEIVIVDDGSTDGTREWLKETFGDTENSPALLFWLSGEKRLKVARKVGDPPVAGAPTEEVEVFPRPCTVRVVYHDRNRGKGAALRTGFSVATGDVFVIQDADLELDPQDWNRMWPLIEEGTADVVYGSRFSGSLRSNVPLVHFLANKIISWWVNLLCNSTLSDVEVCYKMFRRKVLESFGLLCDDFGFEVEFTVKLLKQKKWKVFEVPIRYFGRSFCEGKKIKWKDGIKALWYALKFRIWG